ncbi:putative Phosphodiesterase/Alkaline phosphatase D [Podospora australis]|uniref:Phosphodiesterase/Alkaline phosphatase D n=1 Tax=Podospora australis TaxID=1536484 RepID=A0AAN6WUQ9_9PEZI|nr:putative Phosphodiesterase/Alkaline phosphatase D [Podospora australis]
MHISFLLGLLPLTATALPSDESEPFTSNLNYHSPSRRHVNLGIDISVVSRRSLKRGTVPYKPSELNFTHGVASGDPYPESVILWTRIAPRLASDQGNVTVEGTVDLYSHETEKYIKADANPICVEWKVWEGSAKKRSCTEQEKQKRAAAGVVAQGTAYTTGDIDFTVKVEAKGLKAWTSYNYQFTVCGSNNTSPVGRTKTAPAADQDLNEVRLAVFSCSNHPNGYFNAYGNAARKDKHDYVVHLGDYIYESGGAGERAHNPRKYIFTLGEYRTRHGQYRSDLDLHHLSKNHAWITTWDDHEVSDNGYRDGSSALNNTEASFRQDGRLISVDQRKMNAVRAYFEWMPIRQVDLDDNLRIWRSFQFGNLADLIILDTRNYDRSITSLGWNNNYINLIKDEASRSLMGSRQENWFYKSLTKSKERGAKWRVIGSQIIFSGSSGAGTDNWGGYLANRNRTLKHLYDGNIGNNIFLAGDSHQNWVSDVTWIGQKGYNQATGAGSIGVEFAGTAVSSSGRAGPISAANTAASNQIKNNQVLQWQEGYYRGYFLLSVQKDKVVSQFFGSPTVATRNSWELPLANFTVVSGENKLARPVAGGKVEAGSLRGGSTTGTNLTLNTQTGKWQVIGFESMFISR